LVNIIAKWDFETGDTQGWVLGANTVLDSGSALQGVYSLATGKRGLIASISGIDLSTAVKPYLLVPLRAYYAAASDWYNFRVRVLDSAGNVLMESTHALSKYTSAYVTIYRVVVVDLSLVAGLSGLKIELYLDGSRDWCTMYLDNIAIVDGSDYEYDMALITNLNEDKNVTINIPSPGNNISALSAKYASISLVTPGWFSESTDIIEVKANTDQGTVNLYNLDNNIRHLNLGSFGTAPTTFTSVSFHIFIKTISSYAGYDEVVAVVFLDSSWDYKAFYIINLKFTINGISPTFATALHTTQYGTLVSGRKDYSIKMHSKQLGVAVKVSYLVGSYTVVTSGRVTIEVFSSDLSTKYGEASVDLTAGNVVTSGFITGLPVDTNLVLRVSWYINASARVVLAVTPIFRVA